MMLARGVGDGLLVGREGKYMLKNENGQLLRRHKFEKKFHVLLFHWYKSAVAAFRGFRSAEQGRPTDT